MELLVEGIQKSFDTKEVLKDINFSFKKGNIYGLLGRNGAGKTTLFNCLAGEIPTDGGKAYLIDGAEKKRLTVDDIGYVFSNAILPEFMTGYEFIRFFMDVNEKKITKKYTISEYFDMVKLDQDDQHRLIKGYSQGMKNKLQMMLFIILRPPVILLDEPLTSLDVVVALEMKHLLREIHSEHIIIFSTHILQLATDLCDEIVVLSEGTLEQLDHSMLKDPQFEQKLVKILSEEA